MRTPLRAHLQAPATGHVWRSGAKRAGHVAVREGVRKGVREGVRTGDCKGARNGAADYFHTYIYI